jgi:hypothetical protein
MSDSATDRGCSERPRRLPSHLVPMHVLSQRPPRPLTREEAAAALGISLRISVSFRSLRRSSERPFTGGVGAGPQILDIARRGGR